jgi:hypothetical protein
VQQRSCQDPADIDAQHTRNPRVVGFFICAFSAQGQGPPSGEDASVPARNAVSGAFFMGNRQHKERIMIKTSRRQFDPGQETKEKREELLHYWCFWVPTCGFSFITN